MPKRFLIPLLAIPLLLSGCNRREQVPAVAQQSLMTYISAPPRSQKAIPASGIVGGVPGGKDSAIDKKVIRTAELALVVQNVGESAAKLRVLATKYQGEIDQVREWALSEHTREGELHVRVPAEHLEEALTEFKSLAQQVTNESVNATNVTQQHADNAARMRSLQAEEQQYLTILKQAKSVEDVLAVTEKLNDVRTQIEELQADINVMSRDVTMSAIAITLSQRAPESGVLANWHPWISARRSMRTMVEGLGDWFDSIVSFVIYLPVILLWVVTIGLPVWFAWRSVHFYWRRRKQAA